MILVVGATGMMGGLIVQQLLAEGYAVRVLLRHNSPAAALAAQHLATDPQTLLSAGAQPVYGDLKNPASLVAACQGVTTVITTANAALRGGEDNFATVDDRGTANLINAAARAHVRHFIYTSGAGASPQHPHPLFAAKGLNEARLRASGLDFTILSPGIFMEVWIGTVVGMPLQAGMPVTLIGAGAKKVAFVSMADVVAYAVTAVNHPQARNSQIYIGGPKAYSWTEAVHAVGQALGMNLPIRYVTPDESVPLIPETMGPMLAGMEMADSFIDMSQTARLYGITPTPLETFAARFFGQPA